MQIPTWIELVQYCRLLLKYTGGVSNRINNRDSSRAAFSFKFIFLFLTFFFLWIFKNWNYKPEMLRISSVKSYASERMLRGFKRFIFRRIARANNVEYSQLHRFCSTFNSLLPVILLSLLGVSHYLCTFFFLFYSTLTFFLSCVPTFGHTLYFILSPLCISVTRMITCSDLFPVCMQLFNSLYNPP